MPNVYVIAGPNGAGKTTFAKDYLPQVVGCFEFINNDLVAAGLAPLQPERAQQRAARIVLHEINDLARRGADFCIETTLAGRTYAAMLSKFSNAGYQIHLYYLWMPDVELHIRRVAERVQQGGHDVPEDVIRRRYQLSLKNFFHLYRSLASVWTIIDNSDSASRMIARYNCGCEEVIDTNFYQQMKDSLNASNNSLSEPRHSSLR